MKALNYKFSFSLVLIIVVSDLIGLSVLVSEETLLLARVISVLVIIFTWLCLIKIGLTRISELIVIVFIFVYELLYPTTILKPLALIHNGTRQNFIGECQFTQFGGKYPKSTIVNIDGYHDVTVSVRLFFQDGGCNAGNLVKITSFESFYGYSISYVNVIPGLMGSE